MNVKVKAVNLTMNNIERLMADPYYRITITRGLHDVTVCVMRIRDNYVVEAFTGVSVTSALGELEDHLERKGGEL